MAAKSANVTARVQPEIKRQAEAVLDRIGIPFKNFLVYYLIDEEKEAVWITAVIYGRRDQPAALSDMSLNDIKR